MNKLFLGCIAWLLACTAQAQFRVEVSGTGLTQFPIAVAAFKGNEGMTQRIAAIVQADLERSGQFRNVEGNAAALDENTRPELASWRKQGADALLTGSVTRVAEDRYEVRFRLWDTVRSQDLGGQSHAVSAGEMRRVAHKIADAVYEKLTGEKGVFATRIAYITKSAAVYNLWVADADGEGAQSALRSTEPLFRHPGRPMATNWPMCPSSRANPWSMSMTSIPASAAWSLTSRAPTAPPAGHPTARRWR